MYLRESLCTGDYMDKVGHGAHMETASLQLQPMDEEFGLRT
jgi:hypothetical protein